MLLRELLFAVLSAGILTLLFGMVFRRRGARAGGLWIFFLVVLLATWAGAVWMRPIGPAVGGVHWLPAIGLGTIVALLMAAASPALARGRRKRDGDTDPEGIATTGDREADASMAAVVAVSAYLWVLILGLVLALLAGYLVPRVASS